MEKKTIHIYRIPYFEYFLDPNFDEASKKAS